MSGGMSKDTPLHNFVTSCHKVYIINQLERDK